MKHLFASVLVMLTGYAFGQSQGRIRTLDSLRERLSAFQYHDTSYAATLNSYARNIRQLQPDSSLLLSDQVIAIAAGSDNEALQAEALFTKAMVFAYLQKNDSFFFYIEKVIPFFERTGRLNQYLRARSMEGETLLSYDYSKAIDRFQQVIKATEEKKDIGLRRQKGIAYASIGTIYWGLDLWQEAVEYCKKGKKIFEEINDSVMIAAICNNLANNYMELKQYDTAEALYRNDIDIAKATNREYMLMYPVCGLGILYGHLKKFDESIHTLRQSVALAKQYNNPASTAWNAAALAQSIMWAADETGDKKYSYKEALQWAQQAYKTAIAAGHKKTESFVLNILSQVQEKTGHYRDALLSRNNHLAIRDSILGSNKRQEIAIRQTHFESKMEQDLLQQKHESELKKAQIIRLSLISGAVLVLAASWLLFYSYKRRSEARAAQLKTQLMSEIADTEMKALRSQMNPHFIFNSLNSIRHYTAQNNIKLADDYLVRFSLLMRQVFENSDHKKVSLSDDLHALELYMQIEVARLDHKFSYKIQVDETIDAENTMIPPLLLQPFVENSIWHGISPKNGNGIIKISIVRQSEMICCVVEDNGIGIKKEIVEQKEKEEKKDKPSGIAITRTRISLMNRTQNTNASLQIYPLNAGTRVEINLPLELNF